MFHFAWPWMFLCLFAPFVARWVLPVRKQTDAGMVTVPFYHRLQGALTLGGQHQVMLPGWIKIMIILAWILLVAAIARPQWLGQPVPIVRSGRDIMLAIDISGSMETLDLSEDNQRLTRFDVVQALASNFIESRTTDRVGLILFGTQAYLQTPLTFDRETAVDMLKDASVGLAGPRTAIGDSIGLAIKRLMAQPVKNRILVLLTDGANNAGTVSPLEAAALAAKEHVKIYTVGIGADSMNVQTLFGAQRINPSSDLDEEMLKEIAKMTGGYYFRAKDARGLREVYHALNELEPIDQDSDLFQPVRPLYPWPLGAMLILSFSLALLINRGGSE